MPFLLILGVGLAVGVVIVLVLKPIDGHLKVSQDRNAFHHLWQTVKLGRHLRAYAATTLLVTGGFMLMPFGSAFSVHNLGLTMEQLPMVYMITGVVAMFAGIMMGRFSDSLGKFRVFALSSALTVVMVLIYCNLGVTPIAVVIVVNCLLFIGISGRMIPAQALMSAVPSLPNRGAFMSVNASIQQISGGISSYAAGLIVVQTPSGNLMHYDILAYVVATALLIATYLIYRIHRMLLTSGEEARHPQTAMAKA